MTNIDLLRKTIRDDILINPFQLSGNLYPEIINNYGSLIRDPSGIPVVKTYDHPVRISTRKSPIKETLDKQTPEVYETKIYIMLSDYETIVDIKLEFEYNGLNFRVKKSRDLIKLGEIFGYEYELEEVGAGSGT